MQAGRIRISFSDPDATESDTDDDASLDASKAGGGKTEMVILVGKMTLAGSSTQNPAGRAPKVRSAGSPAASGKKRGAKAERRYRGVYERQPGRWAAEFRSHRLKVRHWIGTFPTEEDAKAAYDAFEAQFHSQPGGGVLPAPERTGGVGRGVHRKSRPPDEKRKVVLALMAPTATTTTTTIGEPSTKEGPVSSTPCVSSLTTVSPAPASQNAQPRTEAPASTDPFLEDEPAEDDLMGLADLSDLPLPFLDGNLDCLLSPGDLDDLSLFDFGFL